MSENFKPSSFSSSPSGRLGGVVTIRVYGICLDNNQRILVTDEIFYGKKFTKFPGGGLQFGEGTIDGVKREFIEETGNEIEVVKHFYTTDFFQASAFHDDVQVLAIYYIVKFKSPSVNLIIKEKKFDFSTNEHGEQLFRWLPLNTLSVHDFELPIDRVVVDLLLKDRSE